MPPVLRKRQAPAPLPPPPSPPKRKRTARSATNTRVFQHGRIRPDVSIQIFGDQYQLHGVVLREKLGWFKTGMSKKVWDIKKSHSGQIKYKYTLECKRVASDDTLKLQEGKEKGLGYDIEHKLVPYGPKDVVGQYLKHKKEIDKLDTKIQLSIWKEVARLEKIRKWVQRAFFAIVGSENDDSKPTIDSVCDDEMLKDYEPEVLEGTRYAEHESYLLMRVHVLSLFTAGEINEEGQFQYQESSDFEIEDEEENNYAKAKDTETKNAGTVDQSHKDAETSNKQTGNEGSDTSSLSSLHITIPSISTPSLSPPDLSTPDLSTPDLSAASLGTPSISLPSITPSPPSSQPTFEDNPHYPEDNTSPETIQKGKFFLQHINILLQNNLALMRCEEESWKQGLVCADFENATDEPRYPWGET
ncbi:hypothetical protein BZA77DRAFT_359517 [Pyronema omphalodes]|nr:hypothetical protein BZA77DRAFT_359517 [Pyronema omphalodes]